MAEGGESGDTESGDLENGDLETSHMVALFTAIPNARVLAAVCQLNGFTGQVLETAGGTLAVLDDATEGYGAKAAEVVSVYAKGIPVLALERHAGQLTIDVYTNGQWVKKLPPGLALADAPGVVLSIATGVQTLDEIAVTHPDKVYSARGSKSKAFWALQKLGREGRKVAKQQGA